MGNLDVLLGALRNYEGLLSLLILSVLILHHAKLTAIERSVSLLWDKHFGEGK
jgi:hypothetical protein